MYKEPCPQCTAPFPFWGPTAKVKDASRLRGRVEFECPACKCRLERRVSSGEKALMLIGALALGTASVLSLLAFTQGPEAQTIAKALFVVAALVSVVEIRNEFVRRRFFVA